MGIIRNMLRMRRTRMHVDIEDVFLDTRNLPGFDTAQFEGKLERPIGIRAFRVVGTVCALLGVALLAQAGNLTLLRGNELVETAANNHLRHSTIFPARGAIYDRNGIPLAFNVPGFRVVVRTHGAHSEDLNALASALAPFLGRDQHDLATLFHERRDANEVVVDTLYDWPIANTLITHFKDDSRILIEPATIRAYADNPAYSHIVGYVSGITRDDIAKDPSVLDRGQMGRGGAELYYGTLLRGTVGKKIVETDSKGAVLSESVFRAEEAGKSIVLGVSAELEQVMYDAIADTVHERGFNAGSGVMLDARTGEVLGLVSYPGYDINALARGGPAEKVTEALTGTRKPLFNRAVSGMYPPASTIKPFIAMAAVEESVIQPDTNIITTGSIILPNPYDPAHSTLFPDWKNHGTVNMTRAIAVSSNAYFYTIGGGFGSVKGLGLQRMRSYLERFGFGTPTGIDAPGEQSGIVPDEAWKAEQYPEDPLWRIGDTYHMSIGQGGMLVTPLQMARGVLAIANGGDIVQPRVLRGIIEKDGVVNMAAKKQVERAGVIGAKALEAARAGMRAAVQEGTAIGVSSLPIPVAAKTGTAQFGATGRVHSWFEGYAPYEDPDIVLVVIMEDGPEHNLVGATYVASQILRWYAEGGSERIHMSSFPPIDN